MAKLTKPAEPTDQDTDLDPGQAGYEEEVGFDFEAAMEMAVPKPNFVDPLPGLYYMRPAKMELGNYDTETGKVYQAQIVWQVVCTVSTEPEMLAQWNGLLSDNHRLGGPGMVEYEKFSIAKQMREGRDSFAARVTGLGGNFKAKPLQDELDALLAKYHPEERLCCKVKLTSKQSDAGYWNIRGFAILDAEVPIDTDIMEDPDSFVGWSPSNEEE